MKLKEDWPVINFQTLLTIDNQRNIQNSEEAWKFKLSPSELKNFLLKRKNIVQKANKEEFHLNYQTF